VLIHSASGLEGRRLWSPSHVVQTLENRLSLAALSIVKILLILVVAVVVVVSLSSFVAAAAPSRAGPSAANGSVLSVFTAPSPENSAGLVSTVSLPFLA
jgi:hypothetical protein